MVEQPTDNTNLEQSAKALEADLKIEMDTPPQPEHPTPAKPTPGWISRGISNPKISKESKQVLNNFKADKGFKVEAEKYGKAIAESIMLDGNSVQAAKVNFEDELKKRIELKGGSYAIIYKGKLPVRISPFIWQLDQGTRRNWAVFTFNNFYGHKDPAAWQIWKKFWKILVLTPFDAGTNMVENFGKGYLAKFDEGSQFQMPINIQDDAEAEKMRVDNKHFISAGLTLWMDLQAYTKAKINMKLVMYLIIAGGIIVFLFYFIKTHPGFLSILHI